MEAKAQPKQEYVIAMYAYDKQHPDDISFQQGDRIKVLEKHQTGWWTGEIKGTDGETQIGNFPSNFVRVEEPSEATTPSVNSASKSQGAGFSATSDVDDESWLGAFRSTYRDRRLRMILRLLQMVSIIVSFGLASDQDSYADYSEFRALVGIGVLIFVYVLIIISLHICYVEARWTSFLCIHQNPFNLMEALGDGVAAIILLSAMAAALERARTLDNSSKAKAAGIFAFLTFMLLMGSSIISWRLFKEAPRKSGAVELH
mmetsp:Transcript_6256/g.8719  ORF Transcript_6256/g.8719 Transcript_6256/m.8719 type:complete len:259 (+) Transcript_6256:61-837(+)